MTGTIAGPSPTKRPLKSTPPAVPLPAGVRGQAANASFAAGLARVTLNENSRNGFQSLTHELTHYMDILNPEGWARLKNKVLAFYTSEKGMGVAQRILDRYGESYDGARIGADELARDLWSGIFSGEENMRSFLEYLSEEGGTTNAEKRTILQTLRDILDTVIEHLRALLRGGDATIGAAEGRQLAEQAETAEQCRELVDEFLQELDIALQNDTRQTEPYDIKKSYAEQIDDAIHGRMPAEGNDILVGRAPKVFQDIGLGTLPLTMTWRHANTVYYASAEEAVKDNKAFKPESDKEEHFHGMGG